MQVGVSALYNDSKSPSSSITYKGYCACELFKSRISLFVIEGYRLSFPAKDSVFVIVFIIDNFLSTASADSTSASGLYNSIQM